MPHLFEKLLVKLERERESAQRKMNGLAGNRQNLSFVRSNQRSGISGVLNRADELAGGERAGFLDREDAPSPFAWHAVPEALQESAPDPLYADEDELGEQGHRVRPIFCKPAWSPDLLAGCMFPGRLLVVVSRQTRVREDASRRMKD